MNELIISVSGLRGIIGESLTPLVAMRYAAAFVADLPAGPIVMSRDGRATGKMLAAAIEAALMACGRQVLFADVAATPTLGVLVRTLRAAGGVQISASHNPSAYNGLKLFGGDGRVIPAPLGEAVKDRFLNEVADWADHAGVGQAELVADPHQAHLDLVLQTVDAERIRGAGFRVLLDSNHGAGGLLGRRLLGELGCDVVCLGAEPTGQFAHPPEPTAEHLREVGARVAGAGAAVGFCQDPDADRLALIDESGCYIGEEYTVALCLEHVLSRRFGPVVVNCATSRMSEDIAHRHGASFWRSAVGEANVVDLMLQHDAVFGGEGNGGPIDPRVVLVRDSFVGMAQILELMATRQQPLSQLADSLPHYEIHKTTIAVEQEKIPSVLAALEQHFAAPQADKNDGLRLTWDDRWLLIRASNTEPIVRAIAEAKDLQTAKALCEQAAEVVAGC